MLNRFIALNLASRLWSALSNFIFIPLYVSLLGINNFAIIALGAVIAGVIAIFDLGMSNAIHREMARTDIEPIQRHAAFMTLRTFYLIAVLLLTIAAPAVAKFIVDGYVNNSPIAADILWLCLTIIIVEAASQLKFRFLVSALMGRDLQVAANIINLSWSFARNGLVLLPIWLFSDVRIFFFWQLGITLLYAIGALMYVQRAIFAGQPRASGLIDATAFARIKGFAAGIFLVSLVAAINTQLDKLIIGRSLDIVNLGYYNLAATIGTGILVLPSAFTASIQPRLTRYFSDDDRPAASTLYMHVASLASALVFPLVAVIAFNAYRVMLVWTGNPEIAAQTASVTPVIIVAYALLAMASLAYGVALANGDTRYNNAIGLLSLVFSVPGYWFAVKNTGIWGAAIIFLCLQSFGTFSFHFLIDYRYINHGPWRSLLRLYVVPGLLSAGAAWLMAWAFADLAQTRLSQFIYLALCYCGIAAITVVAAYYLFGVKPRLD